MSDDTRYDKQVGYDVKQHYDRADQSDLIRFEIVRAGLVTQGLGPDTPDPFQWNCSSSVDPFKACVEASLSTVVVTLSK